MYCGFDLKHCLSADREPALGKSLPSLSPDQWGHTPTGIPLHTGQPLPWKKMFATPIGLRFVASMLRHRKLGKARSMSISAAPNLQLLRAFLLEGESADVRKRIENR